MFLAILVIALNDRTLDNILRQHDTLIVIGQTGKDLIRPAIQQTDKGDPFLLIVLEFHHISLQLTRTCRDNHWRLHAIILFLLLIVGSDQDTRAGTITIDRTTLTTTTPSLNIQLINQFLRDIRRKIDRNTDRMIHPFLDTALHPDLLQPIHIVRGRLIIWRFSDQLINLLLRITLDR